MHERTLIGLVAVVVASSASVAQAHITLLAPTARTAQQKEGPCGAAGSVRGTDITVFEPGETITVRWDETIDHEAHYRIAFDVDGDDDFIPPAGREDLYNSPAVLADGIEDGVGGSYAFDVTLPDVECESCTLQLIQVMYGAGNYYQCADIALRRGGVAPDPDGGTPGGYDGGGPGGYDAGRADAGTPVGTRDAGGPFGDAALPADPDGGAAGPSPGAGAAAPPHRAFVHGGCAAAGPVGAGGLSPLILGLFALVCRRRSSR